MRTFLYKEPEINLKCFKFALIYLNLDEVLLDF
jgi:hypothetical protein